MLAFLLHYGTHFIVPIGIAYWGYRARFKIALITLWSAILIDLDHLWATPIFDPERCSLLFHPLHSSYAIAVYVGMVFFSRTRLVGIGLCLHMVADGLDCLL